MSFLPMSGERTHTGIPRQKPRPTGRASPSAHGAKGNLTPVSSSDNVHSRLAISTSEAAAVRPDQCGIAAMLRRTIGPDIACPRQILAGSEQCRPCSGFVCLGEEPVADCHHPILQSTLAAELKIGGCIARVRGDRSDRRPGSGEPTLQLQREQQVRELRLLVCRPALISPSLPVEVVEGDRAAAVSVGGDGHDSIRHVRKQQIGQGEVAEVVGPDLQLESVSSTPLGCSHDTGVVDQYVNPALP